MIRRKDGVSRREIAAALALAVPAMAQQPPASAEDLDAAAREQFARSGDLLRKFKVPTATEPSFAFRP